MLCRYPVTMKSKIDGQLITVRCGRCIGCRLRNSQCWTLRNLLEFRTAHTALFMTLTLDDDAMRKWDGSQARLLMRNFLQALRKSEARNGNPLPIRFFGCLEYGGTYGRPHFHMLIYNMVYNWMKPSIYRKGLPRPLFRTSLWPHGHVDYGELNLKTIKYTASYITKSSPSGDEPSLFKTIKPGIGFYGLEQLAVSLAKQAHILPSIPVYLDVGDRGYPLDRWARETFVYEFRKHGGRIENDKPDVAAERAFRLYLKDVDPGGFDRRLEKLAQLERMLDGQAKQKAAEIAGAIETAKKRSPGEGQDGNQETGYKAGQVDSRDKFDSHEHGCPF